MLRDLIDSIFAPVYGFLNFVLLKIQSVSLVASRGLNLDYFLGPVALLGPEWVGLIKTIIACITLLTVVFVSTKGFGLYLKFKEGVKWW